ncbi:MAG TPA: hypothetical protein VM305_05975 [Candidatus Limnocylindrales bacterium]|nr:hypothetical protein [Candidatus Limnocylindrales bacterium]
MPDVRGDVKNPAGTVSGHSHHDRVLVSRYASDDAYAGELEQARQLVEACSECATLAADVRTLTAALAASYAPSRRRDFRITPEQAEKLRGSLVDRLFRRLAAPELAPARPLAGVALSIGLAMAVVGAALPAPAVSDMAMQQSGGVQTEGALMGDNSTELDNGAEGDPRTASGPDKETAVPAAGEVPAEGAPAGPGVQPQATTDTAYGAPEGRVESVDPDDRSAAAVEREAATPTRNVLIFGGLGVALLSLGALILVIIARGRLNDPLLR